MGGMVPFFAGKIELGFGQIFFGTRERNPQAEKAGLKRAPIDYYKMLYADTALNGDVARDALRPRLLRHAEHWLFATDAPFDAEEGRLLIRSTMAAIEALGDLDGRARCRPIFAGNARRF